MSGVNKVILVGRLGRDPEIKDAKGVSIANFSIATSESWKDDSGEKQERTEWHNIVAFRKTAELCGKYLKKGQECYIEGKIETRSWDDKETGAKRYKTEIIAQNVQFLGGGRKDVASADIDGVIINDAPAIDSTESIPF